MVSLRTKKKPDLTQFVYSAIGLQHQKTLGPTEIYDWTLAQDGSSVSLGQVQLIPNPAPISHTFYIGRETLEEALAKRGQGLPSGFVDYLKINHFMITADEQFLILLQTHPDLETQLSSHSSSDSEKSQSSRLYYMCQLTQFTKGKPTYSLEINTSHPHPKEVITAARLLGVHFANAYEGILYDPITQKIGRPKPRSAQALSPDKVFDFLSKHLAPDLIWT